MVSHKADMLALLEAVRAEIERGDTVSLVLIPIHNDSEWSTRSAGEKSMLHLAGVLGRAWLTANEALG